MIWPQGNILEAVTRSKMEKKIFVVYIEGSDELSDKLRTLIDDSEITQILMSNLFVTLKLNSCEQEYVQFGETMQRTIPVPSIFFIGLRGIPLHVFNPDYAMTKQSITTAIENAIAFFGGDICEIPSVTKQQSSDNEPQFADRNGSDVGVTKVTAATSVRQSADEKVHETQDIENKTEINKENVNTTTECRDLQKMKEIEERRQSAERRRRDKQEDDETRREILKQIQQDKEERHARFNVPHLPLDTVINPEYVARPPSVVTKINFKFPDGSSCKYEFDSSTTLGEIRVHVLENYTNRATVEFSLSTTYPHHEFTHMENDLTLLELNLTPTCVLLVNPVTSYNIPTIESNGVSRVSGSLSSLVWFLLSPIIGIFGYIRNTLFNPNRVGTSRSSRSDAVKRKTVRIEEPENGNMHRFKNSDSDDEKKTWNGNSTQHL